MSSPVDFFRDAEWTAGVIGLGYVGLPLALTASKAGLPTVAFDISTERVEALRQGRSHVDDVTHEDLAAAVEAGCNFTADPQELKRADAIFICVPSPLGRNRQPDLSYIQSAAETVGEVARSGQLVSLESTSYPGTTEDYLVPAVEAAGLRLDMDVFVAFSPERLSPGDRPAVAEIPKVVGGVTPLSGEVAEAAYRRLVPEVHRVSSARAAEMTKLLENTYRAVNIGLINEMAQLSHELDVNIWEVIEAAATKPFGFHPFYPGPGVGGHCVPLDPHYLAWRAKEANFTTHFIDIAEQVNVHMPRYVVSRIAEILNARGLPLSGTEVLGMGIAYKPGIADARESAALEVLGELAGKGSRVSVMDPVVGAKRVRRLGFDAVTEGDDLSRFHIAVVLTDHPGIDYARIADQVPVVFDTRGVFQRLRIARDNVASL